MLRAGKLKDSSFNQSSMISGGSKITSTIHTL